MFAIGILICVVFVLLFQTFVNEIYNKQSHSSLNNYRNITLASLYLDSWLQDSPGNKDWKVPFDKHSELIAKRTVDSPNVTTELYATDMHNFSLVALNGFKRKDSTFTIKENFLKSLLNPPPLVKPDWSVVLGTFEHFKDDNWVHFLEQIEIPYLQRLFLSTTTETVTISRIFKKEKQDTKALDKKLLSNKLRSTAADFELLIATSFWPFNHDSQVRLGEPSMEHDLDGTDSLNTFFFVAPRHLVHDKIKPKWRTIVVRHFDQLGLNMTIIDKERMVVATRYFKRIK